MTKTEGENGKFALKEVGIPKEEKRTDETEATESMETAERRPASTSKKVPLSKKAKEGEELC